MALTPGLHEFSLPSDAGTLDATWLIADKPVAQVVLAHGAGAGHRHASMDAIADAFCAQDLTTLRFNFPFMQAGRRRVDKPAVAVQAIVDACTHAADVQSLPLFAGGHSFGGRMASHAVAQGRVVCRGLIFCSFPLHAAKKPDRRRAAHLPDVSAPMLFLSGTRDDLARSDVLEDVVRELPHAQLHWLETGNHSYVVLKRTRTNPQPIFEEMADAARAFVDEVK